jgi:hypothetical protein
MEKKPTAKSLSKELHFFPGQKTLIWLVDGKVEAKAEAWGGEAPVSGVDYGIMKPRRTTPGKYVIFSSAPYRTNTWPLSKIKWGTRLKVQLDKSGVERVVYETGTLAHTWKVLEGISKDQLVSMYFQLYGKKMMPDAWVFNDFGPVSVRYFKDKNRNKKLDKGELLSGEMIHTTPINEAQTATSQPVGLEPSHGCIHVKPIDRDRFAKTGAFKQGTDFIIHDYKDVVPKEYTK